MGGFNTKSTYQVEIFSISCAIVHCVTSQNPRYIGFKVGNLRVSLIRCIFQITDISFKEAVTKSTRGDFRDALLTMGNYILRAMMPNLCL